MSTEPTTQTPPASKGGIFGKRQVRFGGNALLMTVALVGILVLLNLLAGRQLIRWDLTADQALTLTPETITILANLDQPVEIVGFFGQQDTLQQQDVASLLQAYMTHTDQLTYRFVDPDTNPVIAREYNLQSYGALYINAGDRREEIRANDEPAITAAIVTVTQETPPPVYVLTGHGERALDGFDPFGFSAMQGVLTADNFTVEPLSLLTAEGVPTDNSILLVADPSEELTATEEAAITTYLAQGGRLLLLTDPLNPAPLTDLLAQAGLTVGDDLLLDSLSEPNNPLNPVVVEYPFSEITTNLNGPTLFATVRSIRNTGDSGGFTVNPLVETSADSSAVTDFDEQELRPSPTDEQGPFTFGFTIEGQFASDDADADAPSDAAPAPARVVVIGDADFASNANVNLAGTVNADFLRSTVAWLASGQGDFVLPPRPQPVDRSIFLTNEQQQLIFYSTTLLLPLVVLVAGAVVWWRNR